MFNLRFYKEAQNKPRDLRSDIYNQMLEEHEPLQFAKEEHTSDKQPPIVYDKKYPSPSKKGLNDTNFLSIYSPIYQSYIEQFRGKSDEELMSILDDIISKYPPKKADTYEWNIDINIRAKYQAAYELLYKVLDKQPRLSQEERKKQLQDKIYKDIQPYVDKIVDLLRGNPYAESIIYTASADEPRQLRGIPEGIGIKVHLILKDIRNYIFDNMRIDNTKKVAASYEVLERFMSEVAKKLGIPFLPHLMRMFGNPHFSEVAREFKEYMPEGLDQEQSIETKIKAIEKIRQQYVMAGVYDTKKLYERLKEQYPNVMTPAIFTQLARPNQTMTGASINTADRLGRLFDDVAPNGNGVALVKNLINLINREIAGQYYTEAAMAGIAKLWSMPVTDKEGRVLNDYMRNFKPITKYEILDVAGFTYEAYPSTFPEDELLPKEEDFITIDGVPQEGVINDIAYKRRIAGILDECLMVINCVEPETLYEFFNYSTKRHDFPPGSTKEMIFFIWDTVCERKIPKFVELLSYTGHYNNPDFISKIENAMDSKKQIDFDFIGFSFADTINSMNERIIINTLRNDYGLMATAYQMTINSPSGCTINPRGFNVDFMFPADVLTGWSNNQNGELQPVVQTQVVFVGEMLGWDQNNPFNPRLYPKFDPKNNIKTPDGRMWLVTMQTDSGEVKVMLGIKKENIDEEDIDAYEFREAMVGDEYKIRTEWKKMYETFVSHILGGSTIFIKHNFTQEELQEELNKQSILWSYKYGETISPSLAEVIEYAKEHPESDMSKYFKIVNKVYSNGRTEKGYIQRKFTPKQAFLISAISQYRFQEGLLPIIVRAQEEGYATTAMLNYFQEVSKINNTISELFKKYKSSYDMYVHFMSSGDLASASREREMLRRYSESINRNKILLNQIKERYVGNIINIFRRFENGELDAPEVVSMQQRYISGLNELQRLFDESLKENIDITKDLTDEERSMIVKKRQELSMEIRSIFNKMNLNKASFVDPFPVLVLRSSNNAKVTASWYRNRIIMN